MPILQAYSERGVMIPAAKWVVDSLGNLHLNDILQVSITTDDKDLLTWINKNQTIDLNVEKIDDKYSVIMSFVIQRFRHMIDNDDEFTSLSIDSMAVLLPINKNSENVLNYLSDPINSDPRFKDLIKGKSKKTKI